jgi:hypothetical protein
MDNLLRSESYASPEYAAGVEARKQGKKATDNPYKVNVLSKQESPVSSWLWASGWADQDMIFLSEGEPVKESPTNFPLPPEHVKAIDCVLCKEDNPNYCRTQSPCLERCIIGCPRCAWNGLIEHLMAVGYWAEVRHAVIEKNRTMWCIPEAGWEKISKLVKEGEK